MAVRVALAAAGCVSALAHGSHGQEHAPTSIPLVTFDGAPATTHVWRERNDPIMGGRSVGTFTLDGGFGVIDGEVVNVPALQAPGFIKADTVDTQPFPDITGCAAIQVTARANVSYAGWRLSFGTAHVPEGRFAFGYKANFQPAVGQLGTTTIQLDSFTDYWNDATGEAVVSCKDNVTFCPDASTLRNLGTVSVWAEGKPGKVRLEIQSIQATGCAQQTAAPAWPASRGLGKGRTCPAWPATATACPLKNISDVFGEFEPVCVLHFPSLGGELAEQQTRRCMPGEKAPYFRDSQGVFRCSCCGAPLWKPSQQFDQQPADRWGWPSFHSPPLNGDDGLPNVCHRGKPVPGVANRSATVDLGLGATGEVGCARCGAHLGDYFDDAEDGTDHYCINGACMIAPGAALGTTCAPTDPGALVV